jgi:hypothetical protein
MNHPRPRSNPGGRPKTSRIYRQFPEKKHVGSTVQLRANQQYQTLKQLHDMGYRSPTGEATAIVCKCSNEHYFQATDWRV